MKRAFTLIEMMIVVALIAVLMTIVLRLSSVSSGEAQRNTTVVRLSRLENCMSGYYAAYGNYPPVRLHNTRDIYKATSVGNGGGGGGNPTANLWNWSKIGETAEYTAWEQVKSACQAQPFGAEFPFVATKNLEKDVKDLRETLQENLRSGKFKNYPKSGTPLYESVMAGFDGLQENFGRFNGLEGETSWQSLQLFKFGVASFILPRLQLMLGFHDDMFSSDENVLDGACNYAQFNLNNVKYVRNPMDGKRTTWKEINRMIREIKSGTGSDDENRIKIENIPSDAVCARWLPNLEGLCRGTRTDVKFYGINVIDQYSDSGDFFSPSDDTSSYFPDIHIYSPDGTTSRQYILDSITILDGWGTEFFYYSPSPHQMYRLWSAGANARTFPPWISRGELDSKAKECVSLWTADDIGGMSN